MVRTSDTTFVMKRVFDAPIDLVYEVMTRPEHVRRWWCCMEGFTMTVCEMDVRVGGRWRFAMVGPDGVEHAFNGVYEEIAAPDRIVQTEVYEPFPDHPALCTMTLVAHGHATHYQNVVEHDSKESCDAHLASGMETGASRALDRIEDIAQYMGATGKSELPSVATRAP